MKLTFGQKSLLQDAKLHETIKVSEGFRYYSTDESIKNAFKRLVSLGLVTPVSDGFKITKKGLESELQ